MLVHPVWRQIQSRSISGSLRVAKIGNVRRYAVERAPVASRPSLCERLRLALGDNDLPNADKVGGEALRRTAPDSDCAAALIKFEAVLCRADQALAMATWRMPVDSRAVGLPFGPGRKPCSSFTVAGHGRGLHGPHQRGKYHSITIGGPTRSAVGPSVGIVAMRRRYDRAKG